MKSFLFLKRKDELKLEVSIDGKRGKAIIEEKRMIDNKIKTKK